eukprot:TRINITY_DN3167_c0_g1_i4.p1 TRINITY_DN3167_c0_g1~~TRINITY_DN3167_c0_g1_i4.p1  ORF type:complete len:1021 (-),score=158.73 TRINITY_DN3167_c0_g1_i4:1973-4954(-)
MGDSGNKKEQHFSSTLQRMMSFLRKEGFEQTKGELLSEVKNKYPDVNLESKQTTHEKHELEGSCSNSSTQQQQQTQRQYEGEISEAEELRSLMKTPPATPPQDFYKNKLKTSSTTGTSGGYLTAPEESDIDEHSIGLGGASVLSQSQELALQSQSISEQSTISQQQQQQQQQSSASGSTSQHIQFQISQHQVQQSDSYQQQQQQQQQQLRWQQQQIPDIFPLQHEAILEEKQQQSRSLQQYDNPAWQKQQQQEQQEQSPALVRNDSQNTGDLFKTSWPELLLGSRSQTIERMDSNASPATPSSVCSMTSPVCSQQDPATQFWVGSGGFMATNMEPSPSTKFPNKMNRVNSLTELSEGQIASSPLPNMDSFRSAGTANTDEGKTVNFAEKPSRRGQKVGGGGGFGFSFDVSPVEEQQTENARRTFHSWNSIKSGVSETPSDGGNSDGGFSAAGGGGHEDSGDFEFSSPDVSPFVQSNQQKQQQSLQISQRLKSEPVMSTTAFMLGNFSPQSDNGNPPLTICDPVDSHPHVPSFSLDLGDLENIRAKQPKSTTLLNNFGRGHGHTQETTLAEHMDLIETASRTSSDLHVDYDPHFVEEQYEVFNLRIIHPKRRTGFEDPKELMFRKLDLIAGRYEVQDFVGSAAFSNAIFAFDIKEKRPVCLKIIKNRKDYFDQSLDEIKLLNYVNSNDPDDSKNVLRLHDYFYYREHLILVCELLHKNLYEWQKYTRDQKLPNYFTLSRVQSIAKQVLTALKFLHSLDLIHADLKPENILIKDYEQCTVKVIDLGSSCFTTDTPSTYIQSRSYRSPEVILGAPYDGRIDVWSLGCILAELLTGAILFQNDTVGTLLSRIVAVFGPFPDSLLQVSKNRDKFITDNGYIFERMPNGPYTTHKPKRTSLRAKVPQADEDCLKFLQYLLTVDSQERPTAAQALEHPWLKKSYTQKVYDMQEANLYKNFNIDTNSPGFEFSQSYAQSVSSIQKQESMQSVSNKSVIPME